MNPNRTLPTLLSVIVSLLVLGAATIVRAQSAAPAVDARTLAKYDKNNNGRLDTDELAAKAADDAAAAKTPITTTSGSAAATAGEETLQLSPFEVKEDNKGYYAASTMSGTRMNTKIEDLAASLSVVTKQQMADFAMLDINDVFAYEAGTEGTGNFTAFEVDRNGMVTDQIQNNPQGANRVRGIGAANIALDNFATSGRVPVDPSAVDAVEISRGPNSNIFGLGEGSGTVNLVASTANFNRESTSAELRFDSLGGWRTFVDVNRPILRGKLGLRANWVYQHDGFQRKPSGFDTRRVNVMLRAQPFKYTSVRASFQSYRGVGTRAGAVTPRDGISWWKNIGRPVWDPITTTVTNNGVSSVTGATNPAGLGGQGFGDPVLFVDGGIKLWMISRMPTATATNGPNNQGGAQRLLETIAEPVRTGRPLYSTVPGVHDRSVYDWTSVNLAAPNTIKDVNDTTTVNIEQTLLDTRRNKLAFQFGWQREDADRINRNLIGSASATGASYYLYMDVNKNLLDGRVNPYYLRPYIGVGEPVIEVQPLNRDSYRGQGAYVLDLTSEKGWLSWLGRHQFLGYYEERKSKNFRYRFRNANITDNPIYAPAGQPKGNQSTSGVAPNPVFGTAPLATRPYFHFYVGDNQGFNADHAPSGFSTGTYAFNWFNPLLNNGAGAWVADQAELGTAGITEGTAGNFSTLNLIKTRGGVIQSSFFQNRVVTTFGKRHDENRNRGQRPSYLKANGWEFDYAQMDGWVADPLPASADGDPLWALRQGDTKTQAYIVRPFRNWSFMEKARSSGGLTGFVANALNGVQFHYNKSDSFRPESPAISILLTELPNPTSSQTEKGFTLNLWDNRVILRANKYENGQVNSRAGQSAIYAQRTLRVDFASFAGNNDAISLQRQARNWTRTLNPTFTTQQVDDAVATIMGLTSAQLNTFNTNTISETSDVLAKGEEYELNVNVNNYWTLRANATRSESIDSRLSPNIPAWIAQRMPVWEKIVDPRVGTPWLDTGYNGDNPQAGSGTPRAFLNGNVISGLAVVQATEGKSRPEIREWRFNVSSNYRLAGLFENTHLKRMSVGGALRWESKAAMGYYGIPVNGDIGAATQLDKNRPIFDKANTYVDFFANYTTRIYRDKVRARFQLNIRNLQENGRLQPIGVYPDGRPHTFRMIDPRTFIFSTTFDM